MYSCIHTTSPSLSTVVAMAARPSPAPYLSSSSPRNRNDSARLGNRTSIGPDTPPANEFTSPAAAVGLVGDAATLRSGKRLQAMPAAIMMTNAATYFIDRSPHIGSGTKPGQHDKTIYKR